MPVKFYLSPQANKAGEFPIRVSISVNGTRYLTTAEYKVAGDAWVANLPNDDKRKEKLKVDVVPTYINKKGISGKVINNRLAKIKAHFSEYELNTHTKPSEAELKEQYLKALGLPDKVEPEVPIKVKKIGFYERLQEFINEQSMANSWAVSTLKNWKTFTNHLKDFNSKVTFDYFDETGINKYIAFLRKEGLEDKTVQKHYRFLKWFFNWALRKGYTKSDMVKRYMPKFKVIEKPVIFLTKEELLHLYRFQIPGNGTKVKLKDMYGNEYEKIVEEAGGMAKTRDMFCFCAFTSLRYSDMAALKRTDIEGDTMYITTQKTNDRLPINLNRFAKEILAKYEHCEFPDNLALPVISNQKMNFYLKDLCELAGFVTPITKVCYRGGERIEETFPKYELIGTHAGRRTFICFALSSGIPPQVVMKWTGHSDYQAMKPYIDIAEKTKINAMQLFENELSK